MTDHVQEYLNKLPTEKRGTFEKLYTSIAKHIETVDALCFQGFLMPTVASVRIKARANGKSAVY